MTHSDLTGQTGDMMLFGPHAAPTSKANTCNHYRRVLINGYTTTGAKHDLHLGAGLSKMLGH